MLHRTEFRLKDKNQNTCVRCSFAHFRLAYYIYTLRSAHRFPRSSHYTQTTSREAGWGDNIIIITINNNIMADSR